MAVEVKLRQYDNMPTLQISGRIIDADAKKVMDKLKDLCGKKNHPRIVVDISNVTFIDSHGLGTILFYHTALKKENRELVVLNTNTNPHTYVNRLFDVTNLNKVLNITSGKKGSGAREES
jgi:anti-anti-sigma factor